MNDRATDSIFWVRRRIANAWVLGVICVVFPPLGLILSGIELAPYLHFPPLTRPTEYPDFRVEAFFGLAVIAAALAGWWIAARKKNTEDRKSVRGAEERRGFPWWGWFSILVGGAFWILAWGRFEFFSPLQRYTFTPLWLAYITTTNALIYHRNGSCPLTGEGWRFFTLFPVSAVFWWFFEYENRFVQNWVYLGVEPWEALEYFVHASVCFSTVLPAVYSTMRLLETVEPLQRDFARGPVWKLPWEKEVAAVALFLVALGFFFVGLYPEYLFPLLWAGPVLAWLCLNRLTRSPVELGGISHGDWRFVLNWAFAALVCGFFWEMWNFRSLAKWVYDVPFFEGLFVFEMPLAGYAGYLPFGLECAFVVEGVRRLASPR